MNKKQILERTTINEKTVQSTYSVGNKVYIVNSSFNGKEQLDNLLYNIFYNKTVASKECRTGIDKKDKVSYNTYSNHSISYPADCRRNFS